MKCGGGAFQGRFIRFDDRSDVAPYLLHALGPQARHPPRVALGECVSLSGNLNEKANC